MSPNIEHLDPALVAALGEIGAYPEDPLPASGVSHVQTHLSHVFLTRDRVYKLHKSVDLGFVSFATQQERNLDCLRELALNRRLAPDVYVGIAAVERRGEQWVLDDFIAHPATLGPGEHCIVMRRLADGRDARSLLAAGSLGRPPLERLARRLAAFHRDHSLGRPSPYSPDEWRHRIARPVEANFDSLLERTPGVVPAESVVRLRELARDAANRLSPAFERRRVKGRAVDGHGDLHLDHAWFETDDAEPIVIDCIAFDDDLRRIDTANDLAFLAMDLGDRGRPDLAEYVLATYAAAADDFDLYHVIDFFISYRAAVRAKVAALEAIDSEIPESQRSEARNRARKRVDYALRALEARPRGRVYLVGGIIGAGKSTVARELSSETRAVIVSSDVVRRSGDASRSRPADGKWREGRYAPEAIEEVYLAMLDRAAAVVDSGRDVILDASWSRRDRRANARSWAVARGALPVFVEIRCRRDIALARLEERQGRGMDASEAGPELYDAFANSFESIDEWPAGSHVIVETDRVGWQERLRDEISRCA